MTKASFTTPQVSVLMNCFNGEKYLKEAIDSVFAQTFTDWEIIFWDNNSSDKTAAIAQAYPEQLRYFKGTETIPLYAARNKALEQARGQFIAILDCDDIWLPTKLEKQVPLFNNPKVGLVYCDTFYLKDNVHSKQLYKTRPFYTGECFKELFLNYFLSLETVVYRKAALDQLDYYFDPRFDMVGDADIARRIGLHWHLDMVNEPLAKWRIHDNNLSFKKFHKHIEETELMIKTYQENIPGFKEKYVAECQSMLKSVSIMKARQLILQGQSKTARAELQPHLNSLKSVILYAASFAPTPLIKMLDQKMSKVQ